MGVSKSKILQLTDDGVIIRLAPGFYIHNHSQIDPEDYDFALACKKFGKESLIGGISALYHYGLIPQVPDRIWVIVPPHIRTTQSLFCLIRSLQDPNIKVIEKKFYRISTIERTIIESLSYASKI